MNSTANVLLTLTGFIFLGLVFHDIYSTILRSSEYSGFLNRMLNRSLWRLALRLTKKLGRRQRHRILSSLGPLLLPIFIALLIFMLITGFALIYMPRMNTDFRLGEPVFSSAASQAFYFSGVTFLTIGYGDILPISGFTRFFALVEGVSGIAFISLSITYLVTVYGALAKRRTVALMFYHQARQGADVSGLIISHFARGQFHNLTLSLREATRNVDELLELHLEYSVINFFHSKEVYRGLPRAIFIVLETVAILNSQLDENEYVEAENHPDVTVAGDSARYVLAELVTSLHLEKVANKPFETEKRAFIRRRHCFDRTRQRLQKSGIKVRDDVESSFAEYVADRAAWEQQMYHLSNFLGYDWEELTGDRDPEDATDNEVAERHEMLTGDKSELSDGRSEEIKIKKVASEEQLSDEV